MFTNIYEPNDILNVIGRMKEIAGRLNRKGGMKSIVIGMPNTGKSSMLNVIRRHATDRKCSSFIKFGTDYRESSENFKSSRTYQSDIKYHQSCR
jgi:GTPase SAR1 family protein